MARREVYRLVDYPHTVVRITCRLCPAYVRHYRVARLAERFGAEIPLQTMIDHLHCGRGRPTKRRKMQMFCAVAFADLHYEPGPDFNLDSPDRLFTKDK